MGDVFTIGHSTRDIDEFVGLLRESAVGLVVDVRSIPRSRSNPQYNRDTLPATLAGFQLGYEHILALGGRRSRCGARGPSPNGYWRVAGFRNYADYALSDDFAAGMAELEPLIPRRPALMCAEAVWWRCHRRIITDYLLVRGHRVFHILGPGHVDPATLTPGARPGPAGHILYPADDEALEPGGVSGNSPGERQEPS